MPHELITELGREYAQALGRKDFKRVAELLDPDVDFRALTPRRTWEARGALDVVESVLRQWFGDSDHLGDVLAVETDGVGDRRRVGYRFRGHNGDGPFVVEQQAYFHEQGGRIDWMRVVCSGFRPE